MNRSVVVLILLLTLSCLCSVAQTPPTSDPQALALIAKSVLAMTGGTTLSGVTLNANAIWIAGSDYFTGPATLQAAGTTDSRIDLNLNGLTRTDIRTTSGGFPGGSSTGASAKAQPFAQHNCWTEPVWFFPALSSLTVAATNTNLVFSYVGQEMHGSVSTQHIRMIQVWPADDVRTLINVQRMSTTEFYLDSASLLPVAIAYKVHPDKDANTDIPMEIGFANYQVVSGIAVPHHIQRSVNGEVDLDLTVTNAVMNSGLSISKLQ